MKLEFSGQILKKFSTNKFNENPFIGSPFVPCRQTDGWMDMTKLMATFSNFADVL